MVIICNHGAGRLRRRQVLAGLVAAAGAMAAPSAPAHAASRRVVLLGTGRKTDPNSVSLLEFIREGFAEQGLVENVDLQLEEVWPDGDYGAFPALAAELVASR